MLLSETFPVFPTDIEESDQLDVDSTHFNVFTEVQCSSSRWFFR